jgi:hypothetical protein
LYFPAPMLTTVNESQIEYGFIGKLKDLKVYLSFSGTGRVRLFFSAKFFSFLIPG